jgi:alpha-beta hydrolase superfamily lysophospholipase
VDVDLGASLAPRLGRDVTCERLPDAIHDVFLSAQPAREEAFSRLGKWLDSAAFG